jgi:zinc transport system substrate-binding protein
MQKFRNIIIISTVFTVLLIGIISAAVVFSGGDFQGNEDEPEEAKTIITTSFYIPYTITQNLVGENAEVVNLTANGVDPHSFEPTPQEVKQLSESNLFIFNGGGFDEWAKDLKDSGEGSFRVLEMSEKVDFIAYEEGEGHSHEGEEKHSDEEDHSHNEEKHSDEDHNHEGEEKESGHSHDHDHGEFDPHFWHDTDKMVEATETIKAELMTLLPDKQEEIEANAEELKNRLNTLESEYEEGLNNCQKDVIVTSHEAYNYLANKYSFEITPIAGLDPNEEVSPRKIAEIEETIRQEGVNYIFFENDFDNSLNRNLTEQTGTQPLGLNPLESLTDEEKNQNLDYFSIMRENLNSLKTGLECQA